MTSKVVTFSEELKNHYPFPQASPPMTPPLLETKPHKLPVKPPLGVGGMSTVVRMGRHHRSACAEYIQRYEDAADPNEWEESGQRDNITGNPLMYSFVR